MQIYPVECLFADHEKLITSELPPLRAYLQCNQGAIVPSDQMIVYLPATDTGPSGEVIGRITFQTSLAVNNELLLPCRPAINVRYLTDPY